MGADRAVRDDRTDRVAATERADRGSGVEPPVRRLHARPLVQARLEVGAADDPQEREADRVAAAIVRELRTPRTAPGTDHAGDGTDRAEDGRGRVRPTGARPGVPGAARQTGRMGRVRRTTAAPTIGALGGRLDPGTEGRLRTARAGGRQLDEPVRRSMEESFGADFSGVRIHTDRAADEFNGTIRAAASTAGDDIFFSRGRYDPSSAAGQTLLAHELTHVVQQGRARPATQRADRTHVARRLIERPAATGGGEVIRRLHLAQADRDIEEDQMTLKSEYFLARQEGRSTDLEAIMKLQSSSAVKPEAIMVAPTPDDVLEAFDDDKIAAGLFHTAGAELAEQFHAEYRPGGNPGITVPLMVKLREAGWLGIHAQKYRESAGGQNGMIYQFCIRGFERTSIGEWHVHWEAKKKAGSPGWKRGKGGEKSATGDEMRPLLGDLWGVVKGSGSGNWV